MPAAPVSTVVGAIEGNWNYGACRARFVTTFGAKPVSFDAGFARCPRGWHYGFNFGVLISDFTFALRQLQVMIVTGSFSSAGRPAPGQAQLPTPPTGWPIGSYATYSEAQQAVDYLADKQFAVQDVTIVGVDLMMVERVIGRLSWGKVLGAAAVSGAWFGLFIGILLSMFSTQTVSYLPILLGMGIGVVFAVVFGAISYASTRGRRDFSSTSQLVAGRYDVLCHPRTAEQGRELLGQLAMRPASSVD
jgi:hypothetical protein